jgi:hypothetical protein
MKKVLLSISMLCIALIFVSCGDDSSTTPTDVTTQDLSVTFSGDLSFKFVAAGATAVTLTGDNTLTITGASKTQATEPSIIITMPKSATGTYTLNSSNIDDPPVTCVVILKSGESYVAESGTLTITELSGRAKGSFNFNLISAQTMKSLTLSSGTFNIPHAKY